MFANWIKNRVEKYGFVENQDFLTILLKTPNGGRPSQEYYITLISPSLGVFHKKRENP